MIRCAILTYLLTHTNKHTLVPHVLLTILHTLYFTWSQVVGVDVGRLKDGLKCGAVEAAVEAAEVAEAAKALAVEKVSAGIGAGLSMMSGMGMGKVNSMFAKTEVALGPANVEAEAGTGTEASAADGSAAPIGYE